MGEEEEPDTCRHWPHREDRKEGLHQGQGQGLPAFVLKAVLHSGGTRTRELSGFVFPVERMNGLQGSLTPVPYWPHVNQHSGGRRCLPGFLEPGLLT